MLFYIISLFSIDFVFDGFIENEWNSNGLLGIFLFSIPIEEWIYAFFLGMIGSVMYEEINNIKLRKYKSKKTK